MRLRSMAIFLALTPILCGCAQNVYTVEMKPEGDALSRKLVCKRVSGSKPQQLDAFPQEELDRIAAAYGAPAPRSAATPFTFQGKFTGKTPNDVGGVGRYVRLSSALGDVTVYAERFRGVDDPLAQLQAALDAIDRLVDLGMGWLETQLRGKKGWPELSGFLKDQARRDVKNLFLSVRLQAVAASRRPQPPADEKGKQAADDGTDKNTETAARALLFLAQRDYLTADDLPALSRAKAAQEGPARRRAIGVVARRILSRKLKLPEDHELCGAVARLIETDVEALGTSFREYLRDTPEWAQLAAVAQEKRAEAPDPAGVIEDLWKPIAEALLFDPDTAELNATLACPVAPVETNAVRDGDVLKWDRKVRRHDPLPPLAFAVWAAPHDDVQKQRFGRVALTGRALASYVFLASALDAEDAKRWNAALAAVRPGVDVEEKLRAFDPAPDAELQRAVKDLAPEEKQALQAMFEHPDGVLAHVNGLAAAQKDALRRALDKAKGLIPARPGEPERNTEQLGEALAAWRVQRQIAADVVAQLRQSLLDALAEKKE